MLLLEGVDPEMVRGAKRGEIDQLGCMSKKSGLPAIEGKPLNVQRAAITKMLKFRHAQYARLRRNT